MPFFYGQGIRIIPFRLRLPIPFIKNKDAPSSPRTQTSAYDVTAIGSLERFVYNKFFMVCGLGIVEYFISTIQQDILPSQAFC